MFTRFFNWLLTFFYDHSSRNNQFTPKPETLVSKTVGEEEVSPSPFARKDFVSKPEPRCETPKRPIRRKVAYVVSDGQTVAATTKRGRPFVGELIKPRKNGHVLVKSPNGFQLTCKLAA